MTTKSSNAAAPFLSRVASSEYIGGNGFAAMAMSFQARSFGGNGFASGGNGLASGAWNATGASLSETAQMQ